MTRNLRILISSLPIAIIALCGVMSGAEAQLVGDTPPGLPAFNITGGEDGSSTLSLIHI